MKKVLAVLAAAVGAVYAKRRYDQQQSEKDLYAATSRLTRSAPQTRGAWASASDRPT